MRLTLWISICCAFKTVSAYLEPPPTTAAANTIQDCSFWEVATSTDQCASIASLWTITVAEFTAYNPSASTGTTCHLVVGNSYCVEENYGIPPVTTTSTSSRSPTPTGNGISTPTPIQTGMVENCNSFYFVVAGDDCSSIASKKEITLATFYAWNPAVGNTCVTLWASVYVCVGTIGTSVTSTKTGSTTTTPTNGIATPTPIRSGMTKNCNTFYLVKIGDECGTIASSKGISLSSFYSWNPAVGTSCSALWADTWVCVNIIGGPTSVHTSTSKISTPTNGISTPTPIQTGMFASCNKFYLVTLATETCSTVVSKFQISLADFYKWNPAVGTSCSALWLNTYVCVGIIGGTTITSTSKPTTTTTSNGIATPTPIQTGMTKSCKKFYKVKSGDTCATVISVYKVTLANFYAWNPAVGTSCGALWLDYYVCVGI